MSTDFFQQQDVARRRTRRLVVLFILAVAAIILVVHVAVAMLLSTGGAGNWADHQDPLWDPRLFAGISLGTLAVILVGSLIRVAQLSAGGEAVALLLGGRLIDRQTRDPAERRLLNVVEEMALASGVPMPPVYVLDQESSINAFAAGHQPGDAVIGVSRGSLTYLSRDELQGVMAHEFSHILNGDMRLDLRLAGLVYGILALAILGYYLVRIAAHTPRSNRKEGGGAVVAMLAIGVALLVVGYIGVFFGKLIKAGVSRQREFLADSAAVQFTRYPAGIAGALKKIGGVPQRSRIRDAHAEEVSHMFFSDAFEGMVTNFFATHPPLVSRIQRIEPGFDGNFPPVKPLAEADVPPPDGALVADSPQAAEIRDFLRSTGKPGQRKTVSSDALRTAIDRTGLGQGLSALEPLFYASALVASMPQPLVAAAHEPYSARALLYALLLDREKTTRESQLALLKRRIEEPSLRETDQLWSLIEHVSEEARMPLVDMAIPALKRLSPPQYGVFRDNVEALVQADAKLDLFEYMIRTMLLRHLDVHFGLSRPLAARYASVQPILEPLRRVLSTLAYAGHDQPQVAARAFEQAAAAIDRPLSLLPANECSLKAFDAALQELALATPKVRRGIVNACVACIAADDQVTARESALLRAVCSMLGRPVPPILLSSATKPEDGGEKPEEAQEQR